MSITNGIGRPASHGAPAQRTFQTICATLSPRIRICGSSSRPGSTIWRRRFTPPSTRCSTSVWRPSCSHTSRSPITAPAIWPTSTLRPTRSSNAIWTRLSHLQTTVDVENRARDIARLVFEQKRYHARDFFRFAEPALRNAFDDFLHGFFWNGRDHLGLDESRRHGIDRDAALCHLERQALGETEQPRL